MAPLLNDSCPIAQQPSTVLEQIFSSLHLRDLASLSQACKLFSSRVGEFLRHECCSSKLSDKLNNFMSKNAGLLTKFEQRLTGSLEAQLAAGFDTNRQAMFKLLLNMDHYNRTVDRVSVVQERVGFPHRGNPSYVLAERDAELGREVVRVITVCWLDLSHTWEGVMPGVYKMAIRVKIGENFRWPHRAEDMTEWTARWPGEGVNGEKVVLVSRDWWNCLKKQQTPSFEVSQGLSVEWEQASGSQTGWVRVEMPELVVEEEGNVTFGLKDVQCPWWKSDILFDFIELRKL